MRFTYCINLLYSLFLYGIYHILEIVGIYTNFYKAWNKCDLQ